jgi:hypothetical protein
MCDHTTDSDVRSQTWAFIGITGTAETDFRKIETIVIEFPFEKSFDAFRNSRIESPHPKLIASGK